MMSRFASAAAATAAMSAVRVAVAPHPRALRPEGLGDLGGGEHRPHREVPAGDALGARQDVRLEPEPGGREPVAAPSEAGDDLVGHEQDARLAADPPGRLEVALGRGEDAAGPDDRLAEERGHPPGARPVDHGGQRPRVVPRDLLDVLDQLAVASGVGRDPGEGGPRGVHPVVGLLAPDQHRPLGHAPELPVPPRHLRGGVDRVGATAREEDLGSRHRRDRRHALGELGGRAVRDVAERGVGGELRHLRRDGVGDLGAPPAHVAVPERGRGVEVAPPGVVPDVRAPATHQRQLAVALHRRHVGERMPEAGHVAHATSGPDRTGSSGSSRAGRRR